MKVYVAGPSADLERCESVISQVRSIGCSITYDWTVGIKEEWKRMDWSLPKGTPLEERGLTLGDQAFYAKADVRGVLDADLLFVCWPQTGHGTFWECGVKHAQILLEQERCAREGTEMLWPWGILMAGPGVYDSIFTGGVEHDGFGYRFGTDAEALDWLERYYEDLRAVGVF